MVVAVGVTEIIIKLNKSFKSIPTISFTQRNSQIESLRKLIIENETKISQAIKEDLSLYEFEAQGAEEIAKIISEIKYVTDHLNCLIQVPSVREFSISEIQIEPYGICLIIGAYSDRFSQMVI
jgi:aldehyde dehydrogenase (NAD+)